MSLFKYYMYVSWFKNHRCIIYHIIYDQISVRKNVRSALSIDIICDVWKFAEIQTFYLA